MTVIISIKTDKRETVIRNNKVSNVITANRIIDYKDSERNEREIIGGGDTLPLTPTNSHNHLSISNSPFATKEDI